MNIRTFFKFKYCEVIYKQAPSELVFCFFLDFVDFWGLRMHGVHMYM
jgi:hypothetical protein